MRFPATLLLALLMLPGCGNLRNLAAKSRAKKEKVQLEKLIATSADEAASRLGEKAVGEIASVSDEYVLLRLLNGVILPSGSDLESRRNGTRTALLKMSPEKNRLFTVADLVDGAPQNGDAVYPVKSKSPITLSTPGTAAGTTFGNAAQGTQTNVPVPLDSLPLLPPPASGPDDFDPKNLPALPGRIQKPEDVNRR